MASQSKFFFQKLKYRNIIEKFNVLKILCNLLDFEYFFQFTLFQRERYSKNLSHSVTNQILFLNCNVIRLSCKLFFTFIFFPSQEGADRISVYDILNRTQGAVEATNGVLGKAIPKHCQFFKFLLHLLEQEAKKAVQVAILVESGGASAPKKKCKDAVIIDYLYFSFQFCLVSNKNIVIYFNRAFKKFNSNSISNFRSETDPFVKQQMH